MAVLKYKAVFVFLMIGCISVDDFASAFASKWFHRHSGTVPTIAAPMKGGDSEEDDSEEVDDSAEVGNPTDREAPPTGGGDATWREDPKEKDNSIGGEDTFNIHFVFKQKV